MANNENLWQQMLRECSVRSKLPVVNLVLVGDAECGKSALLACLDQAKRGTSQTTNETHPVDTILAFKTLDVLDAHAKESEDEASGTKMLLPFLCF